MSDVSGFLTGFSQSLNQYLQTANQNKQTMQNEVFKNQLAEQSKIKEQAANQASELDKSKGIEQNKLDLAGKVTPDMAESLIPGSSKWVQDFQTQNKRLPTVDEAKDGMQAALLKLQGGQDREDHHQDTLFQQGKQAFDSIRGDPTLKEWETKREGSKTVYNTIEKVKAGELQLSKAVYYDLLGQMWKARTGAAPTDQAIRDLDTETFKGDIAKAANYFTGSISADATTKDVLQNLQDFAKDSGFQADKEHAGFMKSRMTLNPGLNETNKQILTHMSRGLSFGDSTGLTKGLNVGDVKKGYVYVGGDPGSSKSWEKQ